MRTAHLTARAGALALALLVAAPRATMFAQDTTAVHRHVLALDVTRLQPFVRSYDMVVHVGDSTRVIGQREVALSVGAYMGQAAWLLVESRTGIVPSRDSLFLAADMRPMHWSSELGKSKLVAEFAGDSVYGATVTPTGRRSIILGARPDLLVSTAMIETLAATLPLTIGWSDSAAVLAVDVAEAALHPVELAVVGEEPAGPLGDSTAGSWLVAIRSNRSQLQLWIDKTSGQANRIEQTLPAHVGSRLEFRPRAAPAAATPLPP